MNHLNKIAMAISVLGCCAGASLHAQTADYNPSWYIAPSINMLNPDGRFGADKNGIGAGLRFGKPISELWDVQFGTTYARSRNSTTRYQQNTLGADALYMFSRKSVRPFLLLGAGYERDKVDQFPGGGTHTAPYINAGVGVQIALGEQWSLQADYRRVHGYLRNNDFAFSRSNNNYLTVGLNYAFDKPVTMAARSAPAYEPAPMVAAAPPAPMPMTPPPPPPPAPMPVPAPAPRFEKVSLSATELFSFDSATVQGSQPKLDDIANVLKNNSQVNNVFIIGYTDRIGSDKYNQKLSERRANAVKDYLVGKGVDANRLKAEGRGEANPLVVCTNKKMADLIQCLEPNRRVEVEQITVEKRVN